MADAQPNTMVSKETCGTPTRRTYKDPPITMKIRGGKPGGGKGPLPQTDMSATLATSNDRTLFEPVPIDGYEVRKPTPRECERLMGMPDDRTKVPYRGKSSDECPGTPGYKALGDSFAVPVVRWVGERMQAYEDGAL